MKPKPVRWILFAAAIAVFPSACRRAESLTGSGGIAGYGGSAPMLQRALSTSPATPASADAAATEEKPGRDARPEPPSGSADGRKLIRNGQVSIEVRDFEASVRKAAAIASMYGGYVSDSQSEGEGSRRHGMVTIRVRAASFDQALDALKVLGKVQTEHVGTQDITKAYTDLEARLHVKR